MIHALPRHDHPAQPCLGLQRVAPGARTPPRPSCLSSCPWWLTGGCRHGAQSHHPHISRYISAVPDSSDGTNGAGPRRATFSY